MYQKLIFYSHCQCFTCCISRGLPLGSPHLRFSDSPIPRGDHRRPSLPYVYLYFYLYFSFVALLPPNTPIIPPTWLPSRAHRAFVSIPTLTSDIQLTQSQATPHYCTPTPASQKQPNNTTNNQSKTTASATSKRNSAESTSSPNCTNQPNTTPPPISKSTI
jgi:hypothetical protein